MPKLAYVFQENVFFHYDIGFVMGFPKDWIKVNSPQIVGAVDSTKKAQLFMGVKLVQNPFSLCKRNKKGLVSGGYCADKS